MATGGRRKPPYLGKKDLQNDDPSILSYSTPYSGNHQRYNQPTSAPSGNHSTGQRQKRNSQTFYIRTNERRNEHWKVDKNGDLARDLFKVENNQRFKFDGRNKNGHQQHEASQKHSHHVNSVPGSQNNGGNPSNVGFHPKGYKNNVRGANQPHRGAVSYRRPDIHDFNDFGKAEHPRNSRNSHPRFGPNYTTRPEGTEQIQVSNLTKADRHSKSHSQDNQSYPGGEDNTVQKNVQFLHMLMGKNGKNEMKITVDNQTNGRKVDVIKSTSQNDKNIIGSGNSGTIVDEKLPTCDQTKLLDVAPPTPVPSSGRDERTISRTSTPLNPTTNDLVGEEKEKRKKRRVRKRNRKNKYERESKSSSLLEDVEADQGAPQDAELQEDNNVSTSSSVTDCETSTSSSKDKEMIIAEEPGEQPEPEQKEEELSLAPPEILQEAENKNPAPTSDEIEARKREELEMGLKQAELRLQKDQIFKLEKKSPTFPEAVYFCQLCSHHLNTVAHAHRHIKDKRHKKEHKAKQQDELLQKLKPPPPEAIGALEHLLQTIITEKMMSPDDAKERKEVVSRLHDVISDKLPACSVVLYGSSVTMIGLKTSDINVELQFPESMKTPTVLLTLLDILKNSDEFKDTKEDFDAKVPRIEITDKVSNLRCSLSANNTKALHTTRLLRIYGMIEPAVVKLSSLFRLWGKLCMVDQQTEGSLPPHSFALMTIFFLQKKHGLPVLHEIMSEHDMEELLSSEAENHIQLELRDDDGWWYCPTAPPGDKKKDKEKTSSQEDDEDEIDDLAEFSDSDLEIVFGESPQKKSGFIDQLDSSTGGTSPSKPIRTSLDPVKLANCFDDSFSSPRLSDLWLEMLKFYSVQFDMENLIISIRYSSRVTRSDRGWSHRRIAIEDPCSPKWNLCKPMNSQVLFSYFMTRLKHSVFYFHTAHHSVRNNARKIEPSLKTTANSDLPSRLSLEIVKSALSELKNRLAGREGHTTSSGSSSAEEEKAKPLNYSLCYKFTKASLTEGRTPVTVCCICKHEGHSKKNCPDEVTVKIQPLPPLTEQLKEMLEDVCKEMFETYMPREEEIAARDQVCNKLLEYLKRYYEPKVKICLFGSSRNGFTFRGSDLDICMTFDGNPTGEGLDFVQIIEDLAKVLRRDMSLRQIIPITTAKVPIVKFYHLASQLDGDISLYNLLAQRNTKMLALYSDIDERCRILGYAMKAFVKRCCIGDASRGSLSSYAYTLLVIYFLQQRNPPVLPVLQELYEGEKCPEVVVDEWNSWFFDDLDKLSHVWDGFEKNKESLGELWLGMLRFYTEDFNFKRHVISIRQRKLLTAFEKEWTSKCICIEDPFDLNHNLGAGVSRKMTNFIMKVFVKAREHFGTEPNANLNGYKNYQDYFFNARVLMDGQEVPNDRCCRICGKIGHFVKDCPKKRNGRKKNGDNSKMKELECFGCGRPGHFKKDCPENHKGQQFIGSPTKSPGILGSSLNYPLQMGPPTNPIFHLGTSPLMQNRGQGVPNIVYAKRVDPIQMYWSQPPIQFGSVPPTLISLLNNQSNNTLLFEQSNNRRDLNNSTNGKKAKRQQEKQMKQNKNGNQRQQQQQTSRSGDLNPSPYPSSGENSRNRKSSESSKVGRNLSNEFEKFSLGTQPTTGTNDTTTPRGAIPTVAEIESSLRQEPVSKKVASSNVKVPAMSQMFIKPQNSPSQPIDSRAQRPRRQCSETDIPRSPTGNFQAYPSFPYSPNYPSYPISPHSPTKHYQAGSPYYPPHFSTSPRQYPMPPSPTDGRFYRSPSNGPMTPPGSIPPQVHTPSGHSSRMNFSPQGPNGLPIPRAVFVNSHYSYPPNQSHPPAPGESQYYSSPRY